MLQITSKGPREMKRRKHMKHTQKELHSNIITQVDVLGKIMSNSFPDCERTGGRVYE